MKTFQGGTTIFPNKINGLSCVFVFQAYVLCCFYIFAFVDCVGYLRNIKKHNRSRFCTLKSWTLQQFVHQKDSNYSTASHFLVQVSLNRSVHNTEYVHLPLYFFDTCRARRLIASIGAIYTFDHHDIRAWKSCMDRLYPNI